MGIDARGPLRGEWDCGIDRAQRFANRRDRRARIERR